MRRANQASCMADRSWRLRALEGVPLDLALAAKARRGAVAALPQPGVFVMKGTQAHYLTQLPDKFMLRDAIILQRSGGSGVVAEASSGIGGCASLRIPPALPYIVLMAEGVNGRGGSVRLADKSVPMCVMARVAAVRASQPAVPPPRLAQPPAALARSRARARARARAHARSRARARARARACARARAPPLPPPAGCTSGWPFSRASASAHPSS